MMSTHTGQVQLNHDGNYDAGCLWEDKNAGLPGPAPAVTSKHKCGSSLTTDPDRSLVCFSPFQNGRLNALWKKELWDDNWDHTGLRETLEAGAAGPPHGTTGANSSLHGRHDKAAPSAARPLNALRGPLCGTEVAGGPSSPSWAPSTRKLKCPRSVPTVTYWAGDSALGKSTRLSKHYLCQFWLLHQFETQEDFYNFNKKV